MQEDPGKWRPCSSHIYRPAITGVHVSVSTGRRCVSHACNTALNSDRVLIVLVKVLSLPWSVVKNFIVSIPVKVATVWVFNNKKRWYTLIHSAHAHTHTHTHIYIYVLYICVCILLFLSLSTHPSILADRCSVDQTSPPPSLFAHTCSSIAHDQSRAPARAVYTAVISDKYTFLRGKCKRFPVILGHTAASGNTATESTCLSPYPSIYLLPYQSTYLST